MASRLICGAFRSALVRTVDHEGQIALPEIGPMLVNDQTLGDVQQSAQRPQNDEGLFPSELR
jgi:protein involved in polysaccharide export with SLBB domain